MVTWAIQRADSLRGGIFYTQVDREGLFSGRILGIKQFHSRVNHYT